MVQKITLATDQACFRPHYLIVNKCTVLYHLAKLPRDSFYTAFINVRAAFDTMPQEKLIMLLYKKTFMEIKCKNNRNLLASFSVSKEAMYGCIPALLFLNFYINDSLLALAQLKFHPSSPHQLAYFYFILCRLCHHFLHISSCPL